VRSAEARQLVKDRIEPLRWLSFEEFERYASDLRADEEVTAPSGRRYRITTRSFTHERATSPEGFVHVVVKARGLGRSRRHHHSDAVLRTDVGPVEAGPGVAYFLGLVPDEEMDAPQRRALDEMRRMLARMRPEFAPPERTIAEHSAYGELTLSIKHSRDPGCELWIAFGDGYLAAGWPGFTGGFGGWDWDPELQRVFEALLSGRNRQVCRYVLGRLVGVTTELWSEEGGWRREEDWAVARRLPLRLLPLRRSIRRRSISFIRPDPVEEQEPR
jgi:hypothetical protein